MLRWLASDYVRPTLAFQESRYCRETNGVLTGEFPVANPPKGIPLSDVRNLGVRELCHPMSFAKHLIATSTLPSASLGYHITRVVSGCPKEQVVRPDATWSIAVVANKHPVQDGPEVKFPRDTGGSGRASRSAANVNASIPPSVASTLPRPAAFALFDFCPKSGSKRYGDWATRGFCDRMVLHGDLLRRCATLPAVSAVREHFFYPHLITKAGA